MKNSTKFLIANFCCIPVIIKLDAPGWYYVSALQLVFLVAQFVCQKYEFKAFKKEIADLYKGDGLEQ